MLYILNINSSYDTIRVFCFTIYWCGMNAKTGQRANPALAGEGLLRCIE